MKQKQSFMIDAFRSAGIEPWSKYIDYLLRAKQSGAKDLDRFLEAYNESPRKTLTPEELCERSGTPARVIIGHVSGQLWDLAYPEANMLLAMSHVAIVKTAIEEAKKPEGIRDRENLLKGSVIPVPKNQVLHLHQHVSTPKAVEGGETHTLPDFESDLGETGDELPMRLLEAPKEDE